jgi:drug/metabolite transporter (DMT)-like permease
MKEYRAGHMLLVSLIVGTPLLWLAGFAAGERIPASRALLLYAAAGVLNFVVGRLLFYIAVAALGASSASIVTSPAIVFSGLLAWAFLGEALTKWDLLGLGLVALSIYIASGKPSGDPLHGLSKVTGLTAGLAASVTFATTAVIIRAAGVESGSPILGAAISYTVAIPAAIVMAARAPGGLRVVYNAPRWIKAVAAIAAAVVALAQLSRYSALSLAPVAEAVVFISLFPLHTTVLAHVILRGRGERVRPVHLLAALVAIAGIASAVVMG